MPGMLLLLLLSVAEAVLQCHGHLCPMKVAVGWKLLLLLLLAVVLADGQLFPGTCCVQYTGPLLCQLTRFSALCWHGCGI